MDSFYTIEKFLSRYYDENSRRMKCTAKNPDDLFKWQAEARSLFEQDIGISKLRSYLYRIGYEKPIPDVRIDETIKFDDHTRIKLYIETLPDVFMPVYMLLPKTYDRKVKYSAVITPHGHGFGAKEGTSGNRSDSRIAGMIDFYNCDYGLQLVRAGYIVFSPDAMGFGERRESCFQKDDYALHSSCEPLLHMLNPLGLSVSGMWAYELTRLADYVLSLDYIDASNLFCAGLSGGGLQTLYFTSIDTRISAAVISGYFYGVKQSILDMPLNCACNYAGGYWLNFDMGDIASMIAPRPVLIETGDCDPLNGAAGPENVKSQVKIAKQTYSLSGDADKFIHKIYKGEHKWYGNDVIAFFASSRKDK
ncbi:MAG: alpha/beta hydrolase family protein [Eubacteriales bacterium]